MRISNEDNDKKEAEQQWEESKSNDEKQCDHKKQREQQCQKSR